MDARVLNLKRTRLACLRCGRYFWTDRCHRICKKCTADTKEPFMRTAFSAEGLTFPGEYRLAEELEFPDETTDTATIGDGTVEEV